MGPWTQPKCFKVTRGQQPFHILVVKHQSKSKIKIYQNTGCSVSIGTIVPAIILNVSKFTTDFASLWLVQTRSKTDFTIGHV